MDTRLRHIFEAISQPLMMEPSAASAYLELFERFVSEKATPSNPNREKALQFASFVAQNGTDHFGLGDSYDYYPTLLEKGTLLIPVMGPILQYDFCWSPGTQTIANWYRQAANDPAITNIIELVDSPGGAVHGTEELARAKLTVKKEIISYVQGVAASAAYYIASSSNKIIGASNNVTVGSIGVMTTIKDYTAREKAMGVKTIEIYSKNSPQKNLGYRDAIAGKTETLANGELLSFDQNFMNFVKEHRQNIDANALEGGIWIGQAAIDAGLIDGIGDLNYVLQQFENKKKMSITSKIQGLFSAAAKSVGEDATEEQLNELQASIASLQEEGEQLQSKVSNLEATRSTLESKVSSLEATLQAKETEITSLNATITQLQAKVREQDEPGATHTPIVTEKPEILAPVALANGNSLEAWAGNPFKKLVEEHKNEQ